MSSNLYLIKKIFSLFCMNFVSSDNKRIFHFSPRSGMKMKRTVKKNGNTCVMFAATKQFPRRRLLHLTDSGLLDFLIHLSTWKKALCFTKTILCRYMQGQRKEKTGLVKWGTKKYRIQFTHDARICPENYQAFTNHRMKIRFVPGWSPDNNSG